MTLKQFIEQQGHEINAVLEGTILDLKNNNAPEAIIADQQKLLQKCKGLTKFKALLDNEVIRTQLMLYVDGKAQLDLVVAYKVFMDDTILVFTPYNYTLKDFIEDRQVGGEKPGRVHDKYEHLD